MGEFPHIFISNVPQRADLRVRLLAQFQKSADVAPVYFSIGDAEPLGGRRRIRELERELEKERTRASPAKVLAAQQGP